MQKKLMVFILILGVCSAMAAYGEKVRKVENAVLGSDGIQRVKVVGGGYFFKPDHIIVKVDLPVELQVVKESGLTPHDIVIKAPEAGINFAESMTTEPKTIRFTPTKPGIYPIYCSKKLLFFESHRDKGMDGVLEVLK
jgi:plastocyanin domain-containing protein